MIGALVEIGPCPILNMNAGVPELRHRAFNLPPIHRLDARLRTAAPNAGQLSV
jgi:hypothetical protein